MVKEDRLIIGKNDEFEASLLLKMASRHGLITGASGTGKTITSKVMAENFSDAGIPVFMADVKGDLSGTACPGEANDNINSRINNLKLDNFELRSYPVTFWDVYRESGIPIRFKVKEVGPTVLSMMLGLSEAQEGVLNILFKIAEDENLDLDDLKDLKYALNYIGENRNKYTLEYGTITTQSVGVILRSLSLLENQGLAKFFGEPTLDINDLIKIDNGRGVINLLDAVELYKNPDLYSAVMLCLLTKLYDTMPEVGEVDKPKIVFFFDEAYYLFREMPSYRLKQIEKIVRLVRSKGIGLYFISHYTTDIPDSIINQLGNRVQHNLKAYTPADQRIAKAAADSFRSNPNFKTYETILELGTGEALVSFLNEKGEPSVVERVTILPPQSLIGVIDMFSRNKITNSNPLLTKYYEDIDDESAYEKIKAITASKEEEENRIREEQEAKKKELEEAKEKERLEKEEAKKKKEEERKKLAEEKEKEKAKKNDPMYKIGKKVGNQATNTVIRKVVNNLTKNWFK